MRVSGGIGRGRKLKVPQGSHVRPTSEKVKQALFNILGDRISGASVLDLFAGAGSIGIEAISRGAGRVAFVDSSRESLSVIKENIERTGFSDRAQIVFARAESFLRKPAATFDIIFLDPPYAEELLPLLELVSGSPVVNPGSVVIAEHFKKQPSPERAGRLALYREARYGDTILAFYKLEDRSQ